MEKIFNVKEYGAIADGKTLNSAAVQAAVDACAAAGGGTVLFENGDFVLSTVFMCILLQNILLHVKTS